MSWRRGWCGKLPTAEVVRRARAGEAHASIAAAAGVSMKTVSKHACRHGAVASRGGDRRSVGWLDRRAVVLGGGADAS